MHDRHADGRQAACAVQSDDPCTAARRGGREPIATMPTTPRGGYGRRLRLNSHAGVPSPWTAVAPTCWAELNDRQLFGAGTPLNRSLIQPSADDTSMSECPLSGCAWMSMTSPMPHAAVRAWSVHGDGTRLSLPP